MSLSSASEKFELQRKQKKTLVEKNNNRFNVCRIYFVSFLMLLIAKAEQPITMISFITPFSTAAVY